jgi:hypothetical protein
MEQTNCNKTIKTKVESLDVWRSCVLSDTFHKTNHVMFLVRACQTHTSTPESRLVIFRLYRRPGRSVLDNAEELSLVV